jgi:hypothetical protein
MLGSAADREILFGLLATQLRFATLDGVSRALASCASGRGPSVRRNLIDQGTIDESASALVEEMEPPGSGRFRPP